MCAKRAVMRGLQEERLGTVIDRFYEAAARPELWRTVLHETSTVLGAEGIGLFPGPKARFAPVSSEGIDEAVAVGVSEHWFDDNPRVARAIPALKRTPVVTESMLFSPEELERLPFHAEYINRYGLRSFAVLALTPVGPSTIFFSIQRRQEQGNFSQREIERIAAMAPHLWRAGQLASRLAEAHADGMLDAFAMIKCGAILIDAMGRAIRLNEMAQHHIGRGLALVHGHLTAYHRDANAALQRVIGSVLQPSPAHEAQARGAVAIPRPEGRPLIIHAAPVVGSARDAFQRAKAILMIVDPHEHREPAEPILRQAFGLTPAEARIAVGLARGQDLGEIAAMSGVSLGTARVHLKAIFAKTGIHRQPELVALLGRMSAAGPSG